jgi:hypothetical protein
MRRAIPPQGVTYLFRERKIQTKITVILQAP